MPNRRQTCQESSPTEVEQDGLLLALSHWPRFLMPLLIFDLHTAVTLNTPQVTQLCARPTGTSPVVHPDPSP